MTAQAPTQREHGNAYNIFILVVTLFSLAVMVLLLLPLDEETKVLLRAYDNVVCGIFLLDFVYNLTGSRPRSTYFVHQRGWLDLLGSIPSFGLFDAAALLRLARLSRLARIARLLSGNNRRELVAEGGVGHVGRLLQLHVPLLQGSDGLLDVGRERLQLFE